jgi:hypothetical protein
MTEPSDINHDYRIATYKPFELKTEKIDYKVGVYFTSNATFCTLDFTWNKRRRVITGSSILCPGDMYNEDLGEWHAVKNAVFSAYSQIYRRDPTERKAYRILYGQHEHDYVFWKCESRHLWSAYRKYIRDRKSAGAPGAG